MKNVYCFVFIGLILSGCSKPASEKNVNPRVDYYDNGKIKSVTPYKNGVMDGIAKSYYENGTLEIETTYKDDQPEGIARYYDEGGNAKSETTYKNGQRIHRKEYDETGNLIPEQ